MSRDRDRYPGRRASAPDGRAGPGSRISWSQHGPARLPSPCRRRSAGRVPAPAPPRSRSRGSHSAGAKDQGLDWHTVKALDKQYMEAQLKRVGTPGPQVIGVDEISIRKGHDYRIVASDLVRGRPIWFGGE